MKLLDNPPQSRDHSENHPTRRQIDAAQRELNNEKWMLSKPFLNRDDHRKQQLEVTLGQLKAKLPETKLDELRARARRPIRRLPDSLPSSSGKKVA